MTNTDRPRLLWPRTFCPKCHQRGIVTVRLPSSASFCLPCLREYLPVEYQNLSTWVHDHPPIDQETQSPGG